MCQPVQQETTVLNTQRREQVKFDQQSVKEAAAWLNR